MLYADIRPKGKSEMKLIKLLSALTALLLTLPLICGAATEKTQVFVTVCTADGAVLAYSPVDVTDEDKDGALTINDALLCAHMASYVGGAEGYASEKTEYGISLTKLWGMQNGGAYGYCLNDTPAGSLADTVKNGDYICAYAYTDTQGYTDAYSYFDTKRVDGVQNEELVLTLYCVTYDSEWKPVKSPLADAEITINGEDTVYKTKSDGTVKITLTGSCTLISAECDDKTIVPPVCVTFVDNSEIVKQTWLYGAVLIVIVIAFTVAIIWTQVRKKKKDAAAQNGNK